MSGDGGRPRKRRRKSFVMTIMEKIGLGGGHDEEVEKEEEQQKQPAAAAEQAGSAETVGGTAAATSAASRSPAQSRRSRQTLQEAARSALRALGESGADDAAAAAAAASSTSKARGKGKGKRRVTSEAEEDEDEGKDVSRKVKGKGKGKGKERARRGGDAAVKTESANSARLSTDVDDRTEDEALASLTYGGKPLMSMRIADCKGALTKLGLSCAGKLPELRLLLAQRLCSDLAEGTPGLAGMQGFEGARSPGSGLESPEEPSARGARRQRRRSTTVLKKGPDTRDSPIVVSGSDDESNASAAAEATATASAAAAAVPPAVNTSVTAVASADTSALEAMPERRGKRTRVARDTADAEAEAEAEVSKETKTASKTKPLAQMLADGPKAGMKFAELREAVKALGLKPKGRKKSDLEECWAEAAKSTGKKVEGEQAGAAGAGAAGERRGRTPVPAGDPGPSVAGVPVKSMKVKIVIQLGVYLVRFSKWTGARVTWRVSYLCCSPLTVRAWLFRSPVVLRCIPPI